MYFRAIAALDKKSETVRDAFVECWVKPYGWLEMVVTDQGTEFENSLPNS